MSIQTAISMLHKLYNYSKLYKTSSKALTIKLNGAVTLNLHNKLPQMLFMNSKHHKRDVIQDAIQQLVVTTR